VEINEAFHKDFSDNIESSILAGLHFNSLLQNKSGIYLRKFPDKFRPIIRKIDQAYEKARLKKIKPDILHFTFYPEKNLYPHSNQIITVNDVIREKANPRSARFERMVETCKRVKRIICISRSTLNDLVYLTGIPEEKCTVIHLAPSEIFRINMADLTPPESRTNSILYVGDRVGYKNFKTLVEAYATSGNLRKNFRLMCVGGPRPADSETQLLREFNLKESELSFVQGDDRTLLDYYNRAAVLVYPSLDEGFGIPPLEAMASGCPTICSNAGALPEVLGNATAYFDPKSVESLQNTLKDILADTSQMLKLQLVGHEHASKFSWNQTAENTLNVYRNILEK
jgi:glycosyltransferase involved in cell wall biosynthesis